MTFYEMLQRHYDEIFPFSDTTFSFLQTRALPDHPVLDIGSATGAYVDAFEQEGFDAIGIELEPALAVRRRVPVIVGDMGRLPLADAPVFGLAYCIGNTLVHLPVDEAAGVIEEVGRRLVDGASFIVQVLNYDQVMKRHLTSLPTITTERAIFERDYVHAGGRQVEFIGRLTAGGATAESSVMLHALAKADLEAAANTAGLSLRLYGDFQGRPYDVENDFMVVAVFGK